jgi:hypothetical protein
VTPLSRIESRTTCGTPFAYLPVALALSNSSDAESAERSG